MIMSGGEQQFLFLFPFLLIVWYKQKEHKLFSNDVFYVYINI